MEPWPDADRGARARGQRLCGRPRSSPLDRGAAQWRRADRRGHEPGPPAEVDLRLRHGHHDATRRRHGGERQPHHAVARLRWRRRGGNPRGVSGRPEPALRHGARRRHLLRRQHRRRGGLSLHAGRKPHRRSGAKARRRSSRPGIGRAACCSAPTSGSSMPGSARSPTSPRTAWRSRKAGPPSTSSTSRPAAAASLPPACAMPSAWPGSPRRARCGPWSTSATGWATRRRPTI